MKSSPFTTVNPILQPLSVTLQDAIAWTDNWRNSDHTLQARSFTFDADEMAAVLAEPGVKQVRFYLCLAIKATNTLQGNELVEKLICVGVNEKGEDMLPPLTEVRDGEPDQDSGIYDFSHPCPPLCNPGNEGSPLN